MQTVARFTLDDVRSAKNGTNGSQGGVLIGRHNGVRFEIWTITPEVAERLLAKVHNRPRRPTRIAKYARAMQDGRWTLNYEWIGIDPLGYVIEGQHRLKACVEAGVPFESLVLIGVSRDLFPSLGTCAPRGVADNVALVGGSNANQVGGALAYLWRAENGLPLYASGIGSRPDNDQALELLARHPKIHESVPLARKCQRIYPSTSLLTYLHYAYASLDREMADTFVGKLADGVGLKASDPVYALRQRLVENLGGKQKLTVKYVIALTIKAWNYARTGRRGPKHLRWSEGAGEAFPEIL